MTEMNNISKGQLIKTSLQGCPRTGTNDTLTLPDEGFGENTLNRDNDRIQNEKTFSTKGDMNADHLSQNDLNDSGYHHTLFYFLYLLIETLFSPVLILKKHIIALYRMLKSKRDVKHSPSFSWAQDHQALKVRRGKIRITDLSLEKRFILECLSDEEIEILLNKSNGPEAGKESNEIESDLYIDEATLNEIAHSFF